MIKSMTGYGLASREFGRGKITVEIKSLNSKFLELNLKLPRQFADRELLLRNECNREIERGKAMVTVTLELPEGEEKAGTINLPLLKKYYSQLQSAADELGAKPDIFSLVIGFPEVVSYQEESGSEEEFNLLMETFRQALKAFQQFRQAEGETLAGDLRLRVKNILEAMTAVEQFEPERVPQIRERIRQHLEDAVGSENVDRNRFEQELIFYLEKLDITEEKIRLKSHCDYFIETMDKPEAGGKKLGFISQEIGREINTMGSKANDARIQQLVVQMKEELEKIKEQLLNVL